jgi:putative acyl-CoA dehydrogenase
VAALDVLRATVKEPEGLPAFMAECELARGCNALLDAHLDRLQAAGPPEQPELQARRIVEDLALALQASLLVRNAPAEVADAFCAGRLGDGGRAFGTLPASVNAAAIVDRALAD